MHLLFAHKISDILLGYKVSKMQMQILFNILNERAKHRKKYIHLSSVPNDDDFDKNLTL